MSRTKVSRTVQIIRDAVDAGYRLSNYGDGWRYLVRDRADGNRDVMAVKRGRVVSEVQTPAGVVVTPTA
jgi:hypothetical protein